MRTETAAAALEIMWKGMAGIFITIIVIALFVWLISRIGKK